MRPDTAAPWKLPYGLLAGTTVFCIVPNVPLVMELSGFPKFGWLRMLYALAPIRNVRPLSVIRKLFLMERSVLKYPGPRKRLRATFPKSVCALVVANSEAVRHANGLVCWLKAGLLDR